MLREQRITAAYKALQTLFAELKLSKGRVRKEGKAADLSREDVAETLAVIATALDTVRALNREFPEILPDE